MSQSSEAILSAQLDPGERLLWSGQPRGGIRLRGQDAVMIPFSLMWGGFAIFWECMALKSVSKAHHPAAGVFPLFGIPFVLIGLYIIFGRFFFDAYSRARTFYGVTNERVIIIRGGAFGQQTKSLQIRTLSDVSLTQRGDGSGTITFGPAPIVNGFNTFGGSGGWPGSRRYSPPAFELIERAKEVYDIVRGAQRTAA
ncbi:MAG: PH domain-containing protein [Chthoniobacteraceae bacterium]